MQFALYFNLLIILIFTVLWFGIVTYLRRKKQKDLAYLVYFTIFYIYIVKVLDYTLFQFQSLLLLKYFMPGIMLQGQTARESLNLLPLAGLTTDDIETSLLNILMMMPFGLGLPFIAQFSMKKIIVCGVLFSLTIEILQYVSGQLAGTTFRIADINDVLFNMLGTIVGYFLFLGYRRFFRHKAI
jgi:glycopeptide antibiotics resistance protein